MVNKNVCGKSPKIETTQMAIIRRLDQQIVIYAHNEILFINENEQSIVMTWKNLANMILGEHYILYDSTYILKFKNREI